MDSKIIAILLVGVIIGGSLSYGGAYVLYNHKITELKSSLSDLGINYKILSTQYDSLQKHYINISNNYVEIFWCLKDLSDDVKDLEGLLNSYCRVSNAIPRVLNNEEVEKTSSIVLSVTGGSSNLWLAYEKIYNYIVNNIDYVTDIRFPVISFSERVINDNKFIKNIFTRTIRNYVQTPHFTLEYEQGDCDDKAVLAYAMIKCYLRNIYGKDYKLYLAQITFSDNTSHLSVFQPVKGPNLCIIDPAGRYLTSSNGSITTNVASLELKQYSNYWSSTFGEITNIELYHVNVIDGSYTVVANGPLKKIALFLEY
jgi:hypothetical protein